MKNKVVLIFKKVINYKALDLAIASCKRDDNDLAVVFIYSPQDEKRGYGFPSDINLAETVTDEKDIWREDTGLLLEEAKLLHEKAKTENIDITIVPFNQIAGNTLQTMIDEAPELYVDASEFKEVTNEPNELILQNSHFKVKCPVILVKKK
ncbi:hypothetical protein FRZ67_16870 [Panacibacter ginsenosidivorans]|uniref:Universal stress protein n=1 Tax=Panacibacter ginsenosidivorans TaxID=1813871 RepID=A0A5B8VC88_9BACT|nr:hypothetical protein [Panacibacter ginsenosidivorans]QEC68899.1 hypothetical protein FRZ67_16870 [Panacibacter ginsenosidivorans]